VNEFREDFLRTNFYYNKEIDNFKLKIEDKNMEIKKLLDEI